MTEEKSEGKSSEKHTTKVDDDKATRSEQEKKVYDNT